MKQLKKDVLSYLSNYEKGFMDRGAARYMYLRDPELFERILNATNFLPNNAKPKQRVWHVINECFDIVLCPVTNKPVKWVDNNYLKYFDLQSSRFGTGCTEARAKMVGKNHKHSKENPEGYAKFLETFHKNRKAGKHQERESPFKSPEVQAKAKATIKERYGVDNPALIPGNEHKMEWWRDSEKSQSAVLKRAKTNEAKKPKPKSAKQIEHALNLRKYREKVNFYTSRSKSIMGINPPKDHQIDHIYSVSEGFKNNIPPYVIGHWSNLQILYWKENKDKSFHCHKTKDQLFEDFGRAAPSHKMKRYFRPKERY